MSRQRRESAHPNNTAGEHTTPQGGAPAHRHRARTHRRGGAASAHRRGAQHRRAGGPRVPREVSRPRHCLHHHTPPDTNLAHGTLKSYICGRSPHATPATEDEDDEDTDVTNYDVGEEALDRLAIALGGKAMMPVLFGIIQEW